LQLCKSPSVDLQKEEFLSPNQLVGRRNRKEPITVAGFSTPKNFNSSMVLQWILINSTIHFSIFSRHVQLDEESVLRLSH